ncbi:MAG TPA: DUF3347 domain-containing protein [Puia sp.]|jgi:Cu(I)/Ag(I) efflux system membrane fusion protein|nr:DUF3347 domain-containing protein [Puia sp.]
MRKFILLIVLFIVAGLLAYRLLSDKKKSQESPPDQALRISKNSGAFDMAFAGLMSDYFALKDALVDWDTLKADQAAYAVAAKADSLPVRLIKADTPIIETAKSLAASIVGEAKGLTGETGIDGRRRSFNMLTSEMYDLIRTVQYDGQKIYHLRCPMAFGDSAEGFWLSYTPAIVNPYMGNKHPVYKAKMIGCGEVTDSLDFEKKQAYR